MRVATMNLFAPEPDAGIKELEGDPTAETFKSVGTYVLRALTELYTRDGESTAGVALWPCALLQSGAASPFGVGHGLQAFQELPTAREGSSGQNELPEGTSE